MGGWDGLDAARDALHAHGMQAIVDFIPNHVGFDHPWIAAHADWFVTGDEAAFRRTPAAFRAIELHDGGMSGSSPAAAIRSSPAVDGCRAAESFQPAHARRSSTRCGSCRATRTASAATWRCSCCAPAASARTRQSGAGGAGHRLLDRLIAAFRIDLFLAERIGIPNWQLQLGFHFTYDKRFKPSPAAGLGR